MSALPGVAHVGSFVFSRLIVAASCHLLLKDASCDMKCCESGG